MGRVLQGNVFHCLFVDCPKVEEEREMTPSFLTKDPIINDFLPCLAVASPFDLDA